jgi:hypothetical protein
VGAAACLALAAARRAAAPRAPSLTALIFAGSDHDGDIAGVDIAGADGAIRRFRHLIGTMSALVNPAAAASRPQPVTGA